MLSYEVAGKLVSKLDVRYYEASNITESKTNSFNSDLPSELVEELLVGIFRKKSDSL